MSRRYLEEFHRDYMDPAVAKYKMAELCATYLGLDCFRADLSNREITNGVKDGEYAFQDYAICNWIFHLQSLQDSVKDLLLDVTTVSQLVYPILKRHYPSLPITLELFNNRGQGTASEISVWDILVKLLRDCSRFENINEKHQTGGMIAPAVSDRFLGLTAKLRSATRNLPAPF